MKSPVEYGSYTDAERSVRRIIETVESFNGRLTREYTLSHSSAGYEPAGSMARWTEPYFSITFESDGAINGRRCLTEEQAREFLRKWLAKDAEDAAYYAEIARTEARIEAGPWHPANQRRSRKS